jgi:hypothetical protein
MASTFKERENKRKSIVQELVEYDPNEEKEKVVQTEPTEQSQKIVKTTEPKLKQRGYYLREDQYTNLKLEAIKKNTDTSTILRKALDLYFDKKERE